MHTWMMFLEIFIFAEIIFLQTFRFVLEMVCEPAFPLFYSRAATLAGLLCGGQELMRGCGQKSADATDN